jgi:hypothetical protein
LSHNFDISSHSIITVTHAETIFVSIILYPTVCDMTSTSTYIQTQFDRRYPVYPDHTLNSHRDTYARRRIRVAIIKHVKS